MEELLSYIVKSLVNHPDDVQIEEQSSGGQVNLILTVNPEDMGLVIGKGGQTIKAIRKLLITKAIVDNVRVNLQLAEPEGNVRPVKSEESFPHHSETSEGPQDLEPTAIIETEPTDPTSQAPQDNKETESPADKADTPTTAE